MQRLVLVAVTALLMATGCAKSGPPPKREPGSWSQKVELKRFEGRGADEARPGIEKMFGLMSAMSACVTPEMAAKEDPIQNLEKLGVTSRGDCAFDRKSVAGGQLDVSGTCKDTGGKTAKIRATGTLGAGVQDMTITIEGLDAKGAREGIMEMAVHSTRNGACTDQDMNTPVAGNTM